MTKLKLESVYTLRKKIEALKAENYELESQLNSYRAAVLEIFDGITSIESPSIAKTWVLKQMKRCFK